MNAGQRSAKQIASNTVLSRDTVCSSCLNRLANKSSRRHASAAAAVAEAPSQVHNDPARHPVTHTGPRKAFRVLCSPVLSRPPQITRELTSFEKAFYLYQKRLNERLALPFQRYFYYKKGTPSSIEFKRKVKARQTVARDIGVYNPYNEEGWDDEVRIGSRLSEPEDIVDRLIRDAEGKDIVDAEPQGDPETGGEAISGDTQLGEGVRKPVGDVEIERPMPRQTEADKQNDKRSLSRRMDQSLYLLVRDKDGWRFPQDRLYGRENLHQAAERVLLQTGGVNMNTWIVGNHPIGHHKATFNYATLAKIAPHKLVTTSKDEFEQEEYGERVFFMKARIMGGQANVVANEYGIKDFNWLTRDEIHEKVDSGYWASIKSMLIGR